MIFEALCAATAWLRGVRHSRVAEDVLGIDPGTRHYAGMLAACEAEGRRLGEFYHWKTVCTLLLSALKLLPPGGCRRLLARIEEARAEAPLPGEGTGAIFAIPDYGHCLPAILSLAREIGASRTVFVFRGSARVPGSNALFDVLHRRILAGRGLDVQVVDDDREGLATVLSGLRSGAVLIMLPDVHHDASDTFVVPFMGRRHHVMLGAAALARKSGARLFPAIAMPGPRFCSFRTIIGEPLEPGIETRLLKVSGNVFADFAMTLAMYRWFERHMSARMLFWQHTGHLFNQEPFHVPERRLLDRSYGLFVDGGAIAGQAAAGSPGASAHAGA